MLGVSGSISELVLATCYYWLPNRMVAGSKSSDGKRDEKFFIVCWDKCHAATYRLKEGESEVLTE